MSTLYSFPFPIPVDHTRVKLKDVDSSAPGAEYINANYIRQPTESEQNEMSSSSENLAQQNNNSSSSSASCNNTSATSNGSGTPTTYASINQQPTKNCQSCQLLGKPCSQCSLKANEVRVECAVFGLFIKFLTNSFPLLVQTQAKRIVDVPVAAAGRRLSHRRRTAPRNRRHRREGPLQDVHRDAGLPGEHDTGLLEHDLAGEHPRDSDDHQRDRAGQKEVRKVLARPAAEPGVGPGPGDLPQRDEHRRLHAAGVSAGVAGAGRAQDLPVPLPGVARPRRPVRSGLRAQLSAGRERAPGAAAAGGTRAGKIRVFVLPAIVKSSQFSILGPNLCPLFGGNRSHGNVHCDRYDSGPD